MCEVPYGSHRDVELGGEKSGTRVVVGGGQHRKRLLDTNTGARKKFSKVSNIFPGMTQHAKLHHVTDSAEGTPSTA